MGGQRLEVGVPVLHPAAVAEEATLEEGAAAALEGVVEVSEAALHQRALDAPGLVRRTLARVRQHVQRPPG